MDNKVKEIIDILASEGYEAKFNNEIRKNGVKKNAIVANKNGARVRLVFYVDDIKDMSTEAVVEFIVDQLENHAPAFPIEEYTKADYIKKNIVLCLQKKSDENIVKRDFHDMELYLRLMIDLENCRGSLKIKSSLLDKAGISVDEAFEIARKNMERSDFWKNWKNWKI